MSINFPEVELEVLERWRDINAFARVNELSEGRPRFTFWDGPPFGMSLQLLFVSYELQTALTSVK